MCAMGAYEGERAEGKRNEEGGLLFGDGSVGDQWGAVTLRLLWRAGSQSLGERNRALAEPSSLAAGAADSRSIVR